MKVERPRVEPKSLDRESSALTNHYATTPLQMLLQIILLYIMAFQATFCTSSLNIIYVSVMYTVVTN